MLISDVHTYFRLKMVVRPKHVADNLNKIVNGYCSKVTLDENLSIWSNTHNRLQTPNFKVKLKPVVDDRERMVPHFQNWLQKNVCRNYVRSS
jgi:hypothetical protein